MRLTTFCSLIAIITILLSASPSHAQFGANRIERPLSNPTVSPYINLFRGQENGPVLNYFGIVRPQLQQMEQNEQFGMNLRAMQGQAGIQQQVMGQGMAMGYSQLNITGHPAVFQSYTNGGGGGGGGGGFGGGGFGGGGIGGGGIGGGFGVGGLGGGGFGAGGLGGVGGFGGGGLGAGGFGGGGVGAGALGGGGFGGGMMGNGFGAGGLGMSGHPAAFGTFTNQRGQ